MAAAKMVGSVTDYINVSSSLLAVDVSPKLQLTENIYRRISLGASELINNKPSVQQEWNIDRLLVWDINRQIVKLFYSILI